MNPSHASGKPVESSGPAVQALVAPEQSGDSVLDRLSLRMGFARHGLEERSRRLVAVLVVMIITPALLGACLYYAGQGRDTTAPVVLPVALSFSLLPFLLRLVDNAINLLSGGKLRRLKIQRLRVGFVSDQNSCTAPRRKDLGGE